MALPFLQLQDWELFCPIWGCVLSAVRKDADEGKPPNRALRMACSGTPTDRTPTAEPLLGPFMTLFDSCLFCHFWKQINRDL